jgi:radical SAM protein with 4Fe4S-binding SPASM domain
MEPNLSRPLRQLVIKPTVFCLHKCPYCDLRQDYYGDMLSTEKSRIRAAGGVASVGHKPGNMPLEMALAAIEEGARLGMESVQLSGGDPILYPHLKEVVKAAAQHEGVFVFVNSVGTGVSLDDARELIALGLGCWNFSVDTLNAEKYDKLRGVRNGLADIMAAIATVRTAAADFPEFCINYMTVITSDNYRDLPELLKHCLDTGVASMYLMNVYGDEVGDALLTEPQIREFRDEIVPHMLSIIENSGADEAVINNAHEVLGTYFSRENSDSNYAKGIYWETPEVAKRACGTPGFYSLIEPDGRVLPCCLVEISHQGEVGNVTEASLTDIWNGAAYEQFREERIPFCQKCSAPRHKTLGLIPKMCRQFNG